MLSFAWPHSITSSAVNEKLRRNFDTERLGGLHVDRRLELGPTAGSAGRPASRLSARARHSPPAMLEDVGRCRRRSSSVRRRAHSRGRRRRAGSRCCSASVASLARRENRNGSVPDTKAAARRFSRSRRAPFPSRASVLTSKTSIFRSSAAAPLSASFRTELPKHILRIDERAEAVGVRRRSSRDRPSRFARQLDLQNADAGDVAARPAEALRRCPS